MKRIVSSTLLASLLAATACAPDASDYTALPEPTNAMATAILDDHLYVYGGHTGTAHDSTTDSVRSQFMRLDLSDENAEWETLTDPQMHVQQAGLFVEDGLMYKVGGLESRYATGEDRDLRALDSFEIYDAGKDTWHALPTLPSPRASHSVSVVDGVVVVAAGWDPTVEGNTDAYSTTFFTYDLKRDAGVWEEREQPFILRDHCAAASGTKVFVLGGMVTGEFPLEPWVYDVAADEWSRGPALPSGSVLGGFGCGATHIGDDVYVNYGDGHVYKLNAEQTGWDSVGQLRTARAFHRLEARGEHELIAVGGGTGPLVDPIDSIESFLLAD